MPEPLRNFFEPRFGYDLSAVRLHTDSRAAESAKEINARAFTLGRDIAFGMGQYRPETAQGKSLLAHELTHVVQQNNLPRRSGTAGAYPALTSSSNNRIARWKISGNEAVSDKEGDVLWNLAKSVTGNGMDWPCIWPVEMKSRKQWEDHYERYIQIGDKFNISNLTAAAGPSHTFSFHLTGNLQALQVLYGGTDPVNLEQEIADLAGNGKTPIGNLVITGHTALDVVWGDDSRFSTSRLRSEEPAPSGPGAWNKMGPRRCWFTRNAKVRIVGCSSEEVARAFAGVFLRKGAVALGTNHWICGWHQTAPTNSRFASVEGPPCSWPPTGTRLLTAADVNAAPGLWVTIKRHL